MAESVLSEDDEVKSTKRPLPYQKTKLSKKARQEEKEDKLSYSLHGKNTYTYSRFR